MGSEIEITNLAKYPLTINFSDSAEEEVLDISKGLGIEKILEALINEDKPFPEELREPVERIIGFISDILNIGLPEVVGPPEQILRKVSRDISLSRLFRERGLVRLYRFFRNTVNVKIPINEFGDSELIELKAYQILIDPRTEEYFTSQEQFLDWICEDGKISRATVYRRVAAYDRLIYTLGYSLDRAYKLIVTRPYIIEETLKELANWEGPNLKHVDPDKAIRLASAVLPSDKRDEVVDLALKIKNDNHPSSSDQQALQEAIIPAMRLLLEQVSEHENIKQVMKHVQTDILKKPEIYYSWNSYLGGLNIEMIVRGIDETGTESINGTYKCTLLPDGLEKLPNEIVNDLKKRLPMRATLD